MKCTTGQENIKDMIIKHGENRQKKKKNIEE